MKKLFLVPMGLALFAFSGSLWSSQASQEQEKAPAQEASPALQTAVGELSRVAPESHSFWMKAADGSEMEFKYNDATQVKGAADSTEGLANMNGSKISVQFEKLAGENVAATIDVLPRS